MDKNNERKKEEIKEIKIKKRESGKGRGSWSSGAGLCLVGKGRRERETREKGAYWFRWETVKERKRRE